MVFTRKCTPEQLKNHWSSEEWRLLHLLSEIATSLIIPKTKLETTPHRDEEQIVPLHVSMQNSHRKYLGN
jgi:hypothetical protein